MFINPTFFIIRWTKCELSGVLLAAVINLAHADNGQYLYVSDIRIGNLWKISTADGTATVIANQGGGIGVTMDSIGNVYVAQNGGVISKIDHSNNVTTYLSGLRSNAVYGKPSGWTALAPFGLARDLFGNFYYTAYYFFDPSGHFIDHNTNYYGGAFKIAPDNTIIAWDDPEPYPYFMNSDSTGNIYLDGFGSGGLVWQYDQCGIGSRTVRGTLPSCHGFTFDLKGNLYGSCISYYPHTGAPNALWTISAGGTNAILINRQFLNHPGGPILDANGSLYVADDQNPTNTVPGTGGGGAVYKYTPDVTGTNWTRTVLVNGPALYDTKTQTNQPFIQPFYMAITPAILLPGQPANVTTTPGPGPSINVSWSTPSGSVTGYHIFRATGTGITDAFTCLNPHSPVTGTNYHDPTAGVGKTYYYKVAAFNDSGTGDASVLPSVLAR